MLLCVTLCPLIDVQKKVKILVDKGLMKESHIWQKNITSKTSTEIYYNFHISY